MNRKIIITSCHGCPFRDHSGGFTPGGAKPICMKTDPTRVLPFTAGLDHRDVPTRVATNVIPSWCPLPKDGIV